MPLVRRFIKVVLNFKHFKYPGMGLTKIFPNISLDSTQHELNLFTTKITLYQDLCSTTYIGIFRTNSLCQQIWCLPITA